MIKTKFISVLCGLVATFCFAQNNSATITYKGEINPRYVDSFLTALQNNKDVPMAAKKQVADMYYNAQPEDFILNIHAQESYYYLDPTLEKEDGYNIGSYADKAPFYTNTSEGKIIRISPTIGLVSLEPLEWNLTGKTKKIGNYTCQQAITNERLFSRQGHYYTKQVAVWFAPEIPLNFGPQNYTGLPGLILQVQRDEFTLTATKINLNPDRTPKITRPKPNDKIITEADSHKRISTLESDRKKSSN